MSPMLAASKPCVKKRRRAPSMIRPRFCGSGPAPRSEAWAAAPPSSADSAAAFLTIEPCAKNFDRTVQFDLEITIGMAYVKAIDRTERFGHSELRKLTY